MTATRDSSGLGWRRIELRSGLAEVKVAELARHLAAGGVLVVPTESSYALAAAPGNARGVDTVYALKRRDAGKPLPVVAASVGQLEALGLEVGSETWDGNLPSFVQLWPAALSLVLPLSPGRNLAAAAGGATVAVRIPAHPVLRQLLAAVGPLTATSANISGSEPICRVEDLGQLIADRRAPNQPSCDDPPTHAGPGYETLVLDQGPLAGGPPSTLVAWERGQPQILRQGAFAASMLPRSGARSQG